MRACAEAGDGEGGEGRPGRKRAIGASAMSGGDAGMGSVARGTACRGEEGGGRQMAQRETGKGVEKRCKDIGQKYRCSNVCTKMNYKHSYNKERTINHDVSSKTRFLFTDKKKRN